MDVLILYLGMAIAGVLAARVLSLSIGTLKIAHSVQTVALVAVIFIMGLKIGSDERVISSLPTIGVKALVFAVLIFAGNTAFVMLGRKIMRLDKRGYRRHD